MQSKTSIFSLTAIGLFMLLCCCKQPIQPVVDSPLNFDEPDTIKSSVSFTLNAPLYTSYRWQGKRPSDTLSKERIIPGGVRATSRAIVEDGINFSHAIKSNFCSLYLGKGSDLITRNSPRLGSTFVDTLRSWRGTSLAISFRLPKVIQTSTTFSSDSVITVNYLDVRYQEYFVAGTSPATSSILSFIVDVFADIKYSPHYLRSIDTSNYNTEDLQRYRTRLESAKIIFDRYDTLLQRVDGRFSFRMIGYDGTVIDVRNGQFLNVKLTRQNE